MSTGVTAIASRDPREGPITRFRGFDLSPFQVEAIAALQEGRDVLVSAPTGAGKTLLAEFAVERCIESGHRVVYTAPIKALSNQKYRDFRGEGLIDVGIMTGDVTIRPQAPLLIMTTEIFRNAIFEDRDELNDVGYVVFDEIHYMDDLERGTVWEESIIFAPEHIRILALSATVSNLSQFCDWMSRARDRKVKLVESKERPVPLVHYLHFPDSGPRRADKVKKLPRRAAPPASRQGQGHGRDRGGRGPAGGRGRGGGGRRGSRFSRADGLLDRLDREDRFPVLFFCFSRKECGIRARDNARRQLLNEDEQDRIGRLFNEVCDAFEIHEDAGLEELRDLAHAGISYHHAGLLPLHKELVERLFTSGLLRLLFTTETFALGINMPARSVIFSSLRKFDGVAFDRLKSRDYQQMAGRAGRQGIDEQGLVFSIVDDPRDRLADIQRSIFGDIEPIRSRFNLSYSSLLNLHDHLGERIYEAWEKSFNNFQWARMIRKKREKNEERQRKTIRDRLELLADFDYIDAAGLRPKGALARHINGFELPCVELVSSGLFRALGDLQIAVILMSVVYEGRKGDLCRPMSAKLLGAHRRDAERILDRLTKSERERNIAPTTRPLDFKLSAVVEAWWNGRSFDQFEDVCNASSGDLVRNFRLVVQLLRQMARAWESEPELVETFERVRDHLNRDEVDARRQLQLGDPSSQGSEGGP